MTAAQRWLGAVWPVVLGRLPAAPARVVEIGCGSLGGFVPMLRSAGYDAVGVDPNAPDEEGYRRAAFEEAELFTDVDAIVASTSLHHVADPREVVARIASSLAPAGTLVVVEWASEDFDEPTARWCFERLSSDDEAGWLHRRRDAWVASGLPWSDYLSGWAEGERVHPAGRLLELLDEHFEREHVARGPYFFPDLAGATEEDELAAIERGEIRATRVDYVAKLR